MYSIELITIRSKPTDFKICKQCRGINWHENEKCLQCVPMMMKSISTEFNEDGTGVVEYLKSEYDFYQEEEGMSKEEADRVITDL